MSALVSSPNPVSADGFRAFMRRLLRSASGAVGAFGVIFVILVAIFAPWLAPYDPNLQDTAIRLAAPDAAHWLGTDAFGRDLLSRLIYGARPTLLLLLFVVLLMHRLGSWLVF